MVTDGVEPPEIDFTEAATVAAIYSSRSENAKIDVDYTQVRNLHKPSGAKPGLVTYTTYWSATVTPDRAILEKMKK
jgi:predicted ribosome quality control (RQC) complex YloA/Tae2 family protein